MKTLIDTGCDLDLIPLYVVVQLGLMSSMKLHSDATIKSICGERVKMIGTVDLCFTRLATTPYTITTCVLSANNKGLDTIILGLPSITTYDLVNVRAFKGKSDKVVQHLPPRHTSSDST